jgi:RNA polymerase sigma factor (sigma-70 family)
MVVDTRREIVATQVDEAFSALTRRHVDSAYRLAWAILGNDGDAEDAMQDAFTLAWRHRRDLRDPDRFDAWFGRILVNVCRQRLKQRSRQRVETLEPAVDATPDPLAQVSARDSIVRAMRSLGPDHRIVILLRYWADMTVEEIAVRLAVPEGTVKSRLHYALRSMRDRMRDAR